MDRKRTSSPLARAIGFGSARSGVEHWWAERVSAIALVPLTVWFFAAVMANSRGGYAQFIAWLKEFSTSVFMVLLLIALFHHSALGLQVVVEDYVHSPLKFTAVLAVRLASFALAIAGIVATLQIAWGA
jgi:succinate dehydrogenase / fumarate reductase membrane anchor subunit